MINEDAIKHSYSQFQGTGYTDDYETFKELLSTNEEALQHAFSMFEETGYTDGIDSFRGMVVGGTEEVVTGDDESPKKKDSTDSSSDDGTLDSEEARPIATDGLPEVEELDLEELDPSIFALDNLPEITPVDDRGNILPPEEVLSMYAGVGDVEAGDM